MCSKHTIKTHTTHGITRLGWPKLPRKVKKRVKAFLRTKPKAYMEYGNGTILVQLHKVPKAGEQP